jgi:hypothetical protein
MSGPVTSIHNRMRRNLEVVFRLCGQSVHSYIT